MGDRGLAMKLLGVLALAFCAGAFCAGAGPAAAQDPERLVRLLGEGDAGLRFVLDGAETGSDEPDRSEATVWYAALPPGERYGELSGPCVEARCALSGTLSDGSELRLTTGLRPGADGRHTISGGYDQAQAETAVRLAALTGEIPEVGVLAPPDAVSAYALSGLLTWAGGFGTTASDDGEPPDDSERQGLAGWQQQNGKPATGLITVADLAALRTDGEELRRASRWTPLAGAGWRAGYPAALLSPVSGQEHRYASADGRVRLSIAMDPPVTEEAWDAFVDQETEDTPEREATGYMRVNDDMEITHQSEAGYAYSLHHRNSRGVARLTLTTAKEIDDDWAVWRSVFAREFQLVGEE
jgi:hypothetical protein